MGAGMRKDEQNFLLKRAYILIKFSQSRFKAQKRVNADCVKNYENKINKKFQFTFKTGIF